MALIIDTIDEISLDNLGNENSDEVYLLNADALDQNTNTGTGSSAYSNADQQRQFTAKQEIDFHLMVVWTHSSHFTMLQAHWNW